jgi:hypothetical protein
MIRATSGFFTAIVVLVACFLLAATQDPAMARPARDARVLQPDCRHDRGRLLVLGEAEFDQDMAGGWRGLEDRGCVAEAADLVRDYRISHRASRMLFWHEGQLRATLGQARAAITLFEKSRIQGADRIGWNHYVDASIAFLKRDRRALLAARASLAKIPRPADFRPRDSEGNVIEIAWPPNLNVVDGMIACFGRSYAEAYGGRCSAPIRINR